MSADLHVLQSHVEAVARKWFELGRTHYQEARVVDPSASPRVIYSRAYYAAYNASKAVRYIVHGSVSLRGDDHKRIAELPDSFPDVDAWAAKLPLLYEHRLRADYDNWSDTQEENQLSPEECLDTAGEFLRVAENFLSSEYGLTI